ncbi:MAG: hypothetical protein V1792_00520 [Pseudomonadota bacterium]
MAKNGRRISAGEVLRDIEDGYSHEALMEKYKLSEKGLQSLFRKLYPSPIKRLGADSVILHTPADELADRLQREARGSQSAPSSPKIPAGKRQPENGSAGVICPSCGKILDEGLEECRNCHTLVGGRRLDGTDGAATKGSLSRGRQNQQASRKEAGFPVAKSPQYFTDWKMISGGLGTIFLFFGTFTPIVIVPIVGGLNCFQVGKVAEGVALAGYAYMVIAAGSIVLVVLKRYGGLWVTGFVSFALLGSMFIHYRRALGDLAARMEHVRAGSGAGNGAIAGGTQTHGDLGGFAEQVAGHLPALVGLDWGWLVLTLGSALLLVSAFLATRDPSAE